MTSSAIMLVYPVCTVLGLVLLNRSQWSSIKVARLTVALFTCIGVVSFVLASFFSQFLWSYLVASFSQATIQTVGVVALNVLFFAPLEDCAGIAAAYDMIPGSFEISKCFQQANYGKMEFSLVIFGRIMVVHISDAESYPIDIRWLVNHP